MSNQKELYDLIVKEVGFWKGSRRVYCDDLRHNGEVIWGRGVSSYSQDDLVNDVFLDVYPYLKDKKENLKDLVKKSIYLRKQVQYRNKVNPIKFSAYYEQQRSPYLEKENQRITAILTEIPKDRLNRVLTEKQISL